MKYIKQYEEYRYFPWTVDPGKHDPNEPYWVWKKGKYKKERLKEEEEKLKQKATFGEIETGSTITSLSENSIVINLRRINEFLKERRLSDKLIEILRKIKDVTIIYEQTDEYPSSFIKYTDISDNDIIRLEKIGFKINRENRIIYWKWR